MSIEILLVRNGKTFLQNKTKGLKIKRRACFAFDHSAKNTTLRFETIVMFCNKLKLHYCMGF